MKGLTLNCVAAGLCLLGLGTLSIAAPPASGYHLIKKVSFGAAEGGGEYFDYITVDSAARRVYLSRGLQVLPNSLAHEPARQTRPVPCATLKRP